MIKTVGMARGAACRLGSGTVTAPILLILPPILTKQPRSAVGSREQGIGARQQDRFWPLLLPVRFEASERRARGQSPILVEI